MPFNKLIISALALAASASLANSAQLVIKGSDTLGAKLVPQLAEAYKAEHPDTTFSIAAEGSSTGFAALIDQTANIGMSSRRATPEEVSKSQAKNLNLHATLVAYDGIAIVVHAENGIKKLSKRQVQQIFTGEVTDWSAVGGKPGKISIYTRNSASGTFKDFKELAMNKREYSSSAQKLAGNEQIVSEVSKNPAGIGYVGLAYTSAAGIKVIAIDGVKPNQKDVRDKSYPYSRPTFYYTNGEPVGEVKSFVDFTVGPKGQKIAGQVGFVPIK